jgi:hypothetical protein
LTINNAMAFAHFTELSIANNTSNILVLMANNMDLMSISKIERKRNALMESFTCSHGLM